MPSGAGSDEPHRPRAPAWNLPWREHRLRLPPGRAGQGECASRRAQRGGAGSSSPCSISKPLSPRAVQADRADTDVPPGGPPLTRRPPRLSCVRTGMDTLTFNVLAVAGSALTLLVICAIDGEPLTGYSTKTWTALLALGLFSQLGAYLALVYALGHLP